jgi:hypothetical protein
MAIDRRTLLKALAAAPAVPLFQSTIVKALASEGAPYSIYFLFHGMFFFEFVNNALYVATPNHPPHKFYTRRHGQGFMDLQKDIDLTKGQLTPGNITVFPTEIPQFPRALISGSPVLPSAATYRCKIILPLPKYIFAYRTDAKSNFHPDISTKIGEAVFKATGPRVATITCLQYDPGKNGPSVDSFYAEHCGKASPTAVNQALTDAQSLLGNRFNLQMQPFGVGDAPEDADDALPDGVTHADENEFRDFTEVRPPDCLQGAGSAGLDKAADVASCPQFGLG